MLIYSYYFSRNAKSYLASINYPYSIPSWVYQWTKAFLEYIKSNLLLILEKKSDMEVEFEIIQPFFIQRLMSPPGKNAWCCCVTPDWNPKDQSTNWTVFFVLMELMASLISLNEMSPPLYIMLQAIYFPSLGSHLTIMESGRIQASIISFTVLS